MNTTLAGTVIAITVVAAPSLVSAQEAPPVVPVASIAPAASPAYPVASIATVASVNATGDLMRHAKAAAALPFRVAIHGSGPPVILIPGLMSSGDVWNDAVARWSRHYELHVLTLAGFAGVPALADSADFLQRARDGVIAYIRDAALDRPVIVGHSLGGFLALWIASTDPSLMRGVVAVDGVPYLVALGDTNATAEGAVGSAAAVRQMYATLTTDQIALQARMSLSMMISDSAQVAAAVEWARESDPAAVGSAMAGMMVTDIRPQVHAISAPVLLLAAGGAATSRDQLERLRAAYSAQLRTVPDSRTVVAEDALHFIMLDDPGFFHETVDPFLADALGTVAGGSHE